MTWLVRDTLSDERTGLSFTIAAGPRQRSHFQVRVPWDSWPYFTVSDWRLPFTSPSTTRSVTVEVFDPTSTRKITLSGKLLTYFEWVACLFIVCCGLKRGHSLERFICCILHIRCRGNVCLPNRCLAMFHSVTICYFAVVLTRPFYVELTILPVVVLGTPSYSNCKTQPGGLCSWLQLGTGTALFGTSS
jgi:hypothetical protein